jgi:hypothetical protein
MVASKLSNQVSGRFPALSLLCLVGLALLTIDACGSRKIAEGPDGGASGGGSVEGTGGTGGTVGTGGGAVTATGAAGGSLPGTGGTTGGSGGNVMGSGGSSRAGGAGGAMGTGGSGGAGGNVCVPSCTVGAQQCVPGFISPFICSRDESGCPRWVSCRLGDTTCICEGPEVPVCNPNARTCIVDLPFVCIRGFNGNPTWKTVLKCGGPDEACTTNPPTCCSNDPECHGQETYCRPGDSFFGLCLPDDHGCFKATPAVFPFPDSQTCR